MIADAPLTDCALGGDVIVQPQSVPPILAWQLVKRPGSNTYDALVGEQIWMYGIYPALGAAADGPAYFRPFEVYERFVRRLVARLHIARQPRQYVHALTVRESADVPMFVGRPAIDAPGPYNRRGVQNLKFEDDLGNRSPGFLSVYFPGTAISKINPKISLSAAPAIRPDVEISGEVVQFTRTATVTPVRDDPAVTVRLLAGSSLAEYLEGYIRSLLAVEDFAYPGGPYDSAGGDVNDSLQRFFDQVSEAVPDELEMNQKIEGVTLQPGETIDFSITGRLGPERTAYIAVETFTENGSTVSEVIELYTDGEGRVYEY